MAECPPVSQLMAFVGHLSWFGHSLAQCPTCLQIRHLSGALFFKGVGFALGLPLGEASGHALSLSFSPFFWALASLSGSVIKGIGGCLDHLI